MKNKYYKILNQCTDEKRGMKLVKINISTLADLLDSSVLPDHTLDHIVNEAIKQLKAQQTP